LQLPNFSGITSPFFCACLVPTWFGATAPALTAAIAATPTIPDGSIFVPGKMQKESQWILKGPGAHMPRGYPPKHISSSTWLIAVLLDIPFALWFFFKKYHIQQNRGPDCTQCWVERCRRIEWHITIQN
jgi:hypothetical protein